MSGVSLARIPTSPTALEKVKGFFLLLPPDQQRIPASAANDLEAHKNVCFI